MKNLQLQFKDLQNKIIDRIIYIGAILSSLMLILIFIRDSGKLMQYFHWTQLVFTILLVSFGIFSQKVSFTIKMTLIIMGGIIIFSGSMFNLGYLSIAKIYIVTTAVLTSYLLSFRASLVILSIFAALYALFSYLSLSGIAGQNVDYQGYVSDPSTFITEGSILIGSGLLLLIIGRKVIIQKLLDNHEIIQNQNKKLILSSEELIKHKNELEIRVKERTREVSLLNEELLATNEELITSNEELRVTNDILLDQRHQLEELVNELRQTQEKLVQSEKMASIGTLTAGIAHEINNPINFINTGVTGLEYIIDDITEQLNGLKKECKSDNEQIIDIQSQVEEIISDLPALMGSVKDGIGSVTNIVKGLRTFSRLDNENKVRANVNDLIESTLAILKNQYKNRINVKKILSPMQPVECYPGRLSQVFLNIINNAIQAIPKDGEIVIRTQINEKLNFIIVSIKDDGVGIPKEILNRVFDPFFTTKEVGKGTGLGLSIAHGIIEEHAGEIDVKSNSQFGTEFLIKLPYFAIPDEQNIEI